jgi:hypothetical protein
VASAFVVFNIKARIVQEKRWRADLSGVLLFSGKLLLLKPECLLAV